MSNTHSLHPKADTNQDHGSAGQENPGKQAEGSDPPGSTESVPPLRPSSHPRNPPRRVDHTYRDYSHLPVDELPTRKKSGRNFPSKLHHILSTYEFAHIISWMPHGRCWKIHDKERLVREVVPRYFVQSKYESFTRQLNGWGFKRLHQSGNDFNAYYHECFLLGLPHLTALVKRVKPNQGKLIPHVEAEPNFYEIDKQFPLPSLAPPMMPYQGHYPYSQGHGTPPTPPTSYQCPEYYAPHPNNYPPPPPQYQYYSGHPDPIGRPGGPGASAAYSSQPGYPSHPFYASQYTQPYVEHEPDHIVPPGSAQPYSFSSPSTKGDGPVKSGGLPWGAEGIEEEVAPVGVEGKGDCLEPWSAFKETENAATDYEHESEEERK